MLRHTLSWEWGVYERTAEPECEFDSCEYPVEVSDWESWVANLDHDVKCWIMSEW